MSKLKNRFDTHGGHLYVETHTEEYLVVYKNQILQKIM